MQCLSCKALFCNSYCRNRHFDTFGSCCDCTNAVRDVVAVAAAAVDVGTTTTTTTTAAAAAAVLVEGDNNIIQEPLVLAARIFCQLLHCHRSENNEKEQKPWSDKPDEDKLLLERTCFAGLCGDASDIQPLEIGQAERINNEDNNASRDVTYTMEPLYLKLCDTLRITDSEQAVLSLQLLQRLAAIVARNGHCVTTQNPFRMYYNTLIRQAGGRGSNQHQAWMTQVAKAMGSSDGTLQRNMDRDIEQQVAVQVIGLFPFAARCNHSCDPNAEVRNQEYIDCVIDVVARRDIRAGEEITYSYLSVRPSETHGSTTRTCHRRRRELYAKYLFHCQCQRCREEE